MLLTKQVLSHQRLSSFTEKSQSMVLSAVIGTSTLPGGSHEFAYELAHRRITQVRTRVSGEADLFPPWNVSTFQAERHYANPAWHATRTSIQIGTPSVPSHMLRL